MGCTAERSKNVKPGAAFTSKQYQFPSSVQRRSIPATESFIDRVSARQRAATPGGNSHACMPTGSLE
jgi:hypothetical protein